MCIYLFYKYQWLTEKKVIIQNDFCQLFIFLREIFNFINNSFLHRMNMTAFVLIQLQSKNISQENVGWDSIFDSSN